MFKSSLRLAFLKPARTIFYLVFYTLITYSLFLVFSVRNISFIKEDAFYLFEARSVSYIIFYIFIFLVALFYIISSLSDKKVLKSLENLNTLRKRKVGLYVLSNVFLSIISIFIAYVLGYLTLLFATIAYYGSFEGIGVNWTMNVVPILVILAIASIFPLYRLFLEYTKDKKKLFSIVPYALFIIDSFLYIFVTKSDAISIIFYLLLILLLSFTVFKFFDYLSLVVNNYSHNKKYNLVLFKDMIKRNYILYFLLSFAAVLSITANIINYRIEYRKTLNYYNYDYEYKIEDSEEVEAILNDERIEHIFLSEAKGAKYNNYDFVIYFGDLTMVSEFMNINKLSGSLLNEENTIVLPSYFQETYKIGVGDNIEVLIDGTYYNLRVASIVDGGTNIISYAYKISGLDIKEDVLLIKTLSNDYDIYNLNNLLRKPYKVVTNKARYKANNNYELTMYIIAFIVVTSSIIGLYVYHRIDFYQEFGDLKYEFNKMGIRNYQVKNMIYKNNLIAFLSTMLPFMLIHLMISITYKSDRNSLFYLFFKNITN